MTVINYCAQRSIARERLTGIDQISPFGFQRLSRFLLRLAGLGYHELHVVLVDLDVGSVGFSGVFVFALDQVGRTAGETGKSRMNESIIDER